MFKAIVVTPNDKTSEFGSLLAFARSEACRHEQVQVNPPVRALVFVAELGVYVALYEVLAGKKSINRNSVVEKPGSVKLDYEKSGRRLS
jgi:hypothetical protein